MRRRVAHLALAVVGLGLTAWGVVLAINPSASCRGVAMGPGDTCHYAGLFGPDLTRVQTYEQRISTIRSNAPVLMGLGVFVAAFGGALLAQELRRGSVAEK